MFRQAKEGEEDEGHMLGTVGIPTPPPRMYFAYQKPIYTHGMPKFPSCALNHSHFAQWTSLDECYDFLLMPFITTPL
jgi:hypothetical protein